MQRAEIADELRHFIAENFLFTDDGGAIGDQESLIKSNIIDSRGILELIFFLEDRFGISIGDAEILPENLETIASIVSFVTAKRAQAAA
jgi:acyl carrier protein